MKFGLFGGARTTPGGMDEYREGYDAYIESVIEAEALGYHSNFLVEHHFSGMGQVSASLNLLSFLAAKTTTIRLGSAVVVLPWHNPALIAEQARLGEVWVIEDNGSAVACVFLSPKPNAMYIGKLAVAATHRGRGLARVLVAVAETRARDLALPVLMLQTRVELTENHATFNALGFAITGTTSHEGFDRPTSITMEREVPAR